jgi:hypothetical protein
MILSMYILKASNQIWFNVSGMRIKVTGQHPDCNTQKAGLRPEMKGQDMRGCHMDQNRSRCITCRTMRWCHDKGHAMTQHHDIRFLYSMQMHRSGGLGECTKTMNVNALAVVERGHLKHRAITNFLFTILDRLLPRSIIPSSLRIPISPALLRHRLFALALSRASGNVSGTLSTARLTPPGASGMPSLTSSVAGSFSTLQPSVLKRSCTLRRVTSQRLHYNIQAKPMK